MSMISAYNFYSIFYNTIAQNRGNTVHNNRCRIYNIYTFGAQTARFSRHNCITQAVKNPIQISFLLFLLIVRF